MARVPFPLVTGLSEDTRRQLYRNYEALQLPVTVLYSTPAALVPGILDPRWYPPFVGSILEVRINVDTAPTGTVTVDILKNGTSLFPISAKPTVATGAFVDTVFRVPDTRAFSHLSNDYLEIEVEDAGSATGLVVSMNIDRRS